MNIYFEVEWFFKKERGLLSINIDKGYFSMETLCGADLPVSLLLPVINRLLGEGWLFQIEKAHQKRALPWTVQIKENGHKTEYSLHSYCCGQTIVCSEIHVTDGKLSLGLCLKQTDIPPLLAKVMEDYPPVENFWMKFQEPHYQTDIPKKYVSPGEPSGVKDFLEALEVMAVLSGVSVTDSTFTTNTILSTIL